MNTKMADIFKVAFLIFVYISSVASISPKEYTDKSTGYHYTVHREHATWIKAYEFCKTDNSDLLYIETAAELQFIQQSLNNNSGVRNIYNRDRLWTSGSDIFLENHHVWIPTGKVILATLWAPGEPNNEKRGEHCIEALQWSSPFVNLYINDALCSDEKHFVCKKNVTEADSEDRNQMNVEAHVRKEECERHDFGYLYLVLVIVAIAAVVLIAVVLKFRKEILNKLQSGNTGGRIALYQRT